MVSIPHTHIQKGSSDVFSRKNKIKNEMLVLLGFIHIIGRENPVELRKQNVFRNNSATKQLFF